MMMRTDFSIGELAADAGSTVQTIRYYEQTGLLPAPPRTRGNQRRYDERHRRRLAFIRHSRDLGFNLADIRALLSLADRPDHKCVEADRIARIHLAKIESRLARLTALKTELERMVAQCGGGLIADCRIIEVLSDHGRCLSAHASDKAHDKSWLAQGS